MSSRIDDTAAENCVWVAVSSAIIIALLVVLSALAFVNNAIPYSWIESFSFSSHPRFVNHIQVPIVFMLAFGVLFPPGTRIRLTRFLSLLSLVLTFFCIYISAGRGVWLSLVVGSLACFYVSKTYGIRLLIVILLAGLIGFVLSLLYGFYVSGGQGVSAGLLVRENLLVDNRTMLWEVALGGVFDSPFFGHGAYSYATSSLVPEGLPAHPHQHFLQLAFEYGLPLTICFYGFLGGVMVGYARYIKRSGSAFDCYVFCGLTAMVVNAQYSAVLTMPLGQWFFVLLFSVALFKMKKPKAAFSDKKCSGFFRSVVTVVLSLSLVYWWAVVFDYSRGLQSGVFELNRTHDGRKFLPRTWGNAH